MKIKIIIILLFLTILQHVSAQSWEHNLEKYWHYRDRLESDFMIVGQPERQGTNLPAAIIHARWSGNGFGGGENPFKDGFGPYLAVLATEYRLLADYGHVTEARQTLQKIAWALESFDRIDRNTEKYFRTVKEDINNTDPDYWTKANNLIESSDLNGFFMRGDVDGLIEDNRYYTESDGITPQYNEDGTIKYIWSDYGKRVYPENPDGFLFSIKPELRESSYIGAPEMNVCLSLFCNKPIENKNKTVMSDDEIMALYFGLSFLDEYVDSPQLFSTANGSMTIKEWVKDIVLRVAETMTSPLNPVWHIHNPVTFQWPDEVNPSYVTNAPAYSKLLSDRFDLSIGSAANSQELFFSGISQAAHNYGWNATENMFAHNNTLMVGALTGKVININELNSFDAFERVYYLATDYFEQPTYEFLPLVYASMNDKNIFDEWNDHVCNDCGYHSAHDFQNDVFNLLSAAPDCGPEFFPGVEPNKLWFRGTRLFPTKNKFIRIDSNFALADSYEMGYPNGLDYMLLHNLYWLHFVPKPGAADFLYDDKNYPFSPFPMAPMIEYGSHDIPFNLQARDRITSTAIVSSDGDISYHAGKEVVLEPGFETEIGASFEALASSSFYYDYKYVEFKPECYYPGAKSIISKRAAMNVQDSIISNESAEKSNYLPEIEEELLVLTELRIYPNPANTSLQIETGKYAQLEIQLYDIYGKELYTAQQQERGTHEINTSNFKSGIYFLRISGPEIQKSEKIIIEH